MNPQEFHVIREQLGKTQRQLSALLGTSLKAVQSFEQGWRKVPVHIERQILFLLTCRKIKVREGRPCWEIQKCLLETRQACPAWEFNAGHLCWFINGTICHGVPRTSWTSKMRLCRTCEVFQKNTGAFVSKKK
jgi:hypothetical protein